MNDYVPGVAPRPSERSGGKPQPPDTTTHTSPDAVAQGTVSVMGSGRGESKPEAKARQQVSLDELAEMLRKVNLTFDLFEIAAEYTVQQEPHRILVVIRNTRTGKVIRRIPPEEFVANYSDIRNGLGTLINASV